MSSPSLYAKAVPFDHRLPGAVRIFIDRVRHDLPPEDENRYEALSQSDGGGFAWRKAALFEYDNPNDGIPLDADQAQRLMDSLWDCGLRPAAGSGSAGSLAATQDHLATAKKLLDHFMAAQNPLAIPLANSQTLAANLAHSAAVASERTIADISGEVVRRTLEIERRGGKTISKSSGRLQDLIDRIEDAILSKEKEAMQRDIATP